MNNFNVAVVANQPFYEQMKALEIAHLKNFSKQQFDELAKFNPQIVFIGILDPELIKKIRTQINPINIIGLTYERKISNWLAGGVDECLVMPVSSSEITNNLVVWGRITNSLNQSQLAAIKLVENLIAKETKANQPVDKLQPAAKSIDEKPKIKQVVHQPTEQQPEVKPKVEKPTEVIYPDPKVQKTLNKPIEQPEKPKIDKQPDKQLQQSDKQLLKEAVEPPVEGHDKQLEDELLSDLDDKTVEPDTKLKSVEKSPEKGSEDQTDNHIKDQAENQEPVKKPVENDNSDNHSVGNADSPEKTENNDNTEKKDDNSQSEDNSDDDDIDLNDDSAFERIMNETKTGELSLDEDEDEDKKTEEEDESEDDDSNSNNSDDTAANEPQKQETVDETDQNVEADDQKANSQGQASSPTSEKEVVDKQPADDSGKQPVGDDNRQTVDDNQPQAPESDSSAKPANDQSDDFMSKLNSLLVGLNGDDQPKSKKQPADKVVTKTPVDADPGTSQSKHRVIDPNEPKHHIVTSAEQKEAMKRQALDNAQNHILTNIDIKALLKAYPDDAPKIKQVHEYIQRQQDEKRKEIVALKRLQREPIPKIIAKQKTKKQDPLDQLRNLKLKPVNNSNDVADNQPKEASKPQDTGTKPETSAPVKEPIKAPEETKTPEVQKPVAPNPIEKPVETQPAPTPGDQQPVKSKPVEHPQTLLHFNEDNKSQPEVQQPQPPVTQPKPPVQAQPPVQPAQPQPHPPVEVESQSSVRPVQQPQQPAPSQDEKDKVKILSPNADLPDLGNVQNNENQYQQLLKQQQKAAQKDASNVDKSDETIPNADLDVDPTKGNNTNVKESATLEVDHPNNKKKKHHLGLGKLFGLRKKS